MKCLACLLVCNAPRAAQFPDPTVAALEFFQAGQKFGTAGLHAESSQALGKSAELKARHGDPLGAARAYEMAGAASTRAGQPATASWTRAAEEYRLAGKAEPAVKVP